MANRVHSKGPFVHEEALAGEAGIYPGMNLYMRQDGKVYLHATEGGGGEVLIAEEDALQGKTVDDVYTINNTCMISIPNKGSEFNVLLKAGEVAVIGSNLISGGDGTFKVSENIASGSTIDDNNVLAVAQEAVTPGASNALVAARII